MNILALDPACTTGFAWTDGVTTKHGVWHLNQRARLSDLFDKIMDVQTNWGPLTKIVYEDASFGSPNPNVQASHNELRGIIRLISERLCIPAIGYKPASIKAMTGSGRASKEDMKRACKILLGFDVNSDDEADALFLLECGKQGLVIASKPKQRSRRPKLRAERLF